MRKEFRGNEQRGGLLGLAGAPGLRVGQEVPCPLLGCLNDPPSLIHAPNLEGTELGFTQGTDCGSSLLG